LVFSSGDRSIIVDMKKSAMVRTALTTKLNEACFPDRTDYDPYVKWLSDKLQANYSNENRYRSMVDENSPLRPTMRLPLNDKAGKRPDTKLENRPLKPVATFRFNSEAVVQGSKVKVHSAMEKVVDTAELREQYPDLFRGGEVVPADEWSMKGEAYGKYYDELFKEEDVKLAKVDKAYRRDRNQGVFVVSQQWQE
jgi:hypothetical protein